MRADLRKSGLKFSGEVLWGTHLCQFYQSRQDLIETLVPYFKQGLEDNEFCMWVTSAPLGVEDAKAALKEKVKNLDDYIKKGQIEILDYSQWYTKTGAFEADKVLEGWVKKEKQAIERGFDGLRLTGNTFWLEKKDWNSFINYEAIVDSVIGQHRMLVVCSYSLDRCQADEVIDVVNNHKFACIKRKGKWMFLESSERKKAEEVLRASEARYRLLAENLPQKIFIKDRNSVYIFCNKNYARDLKIRSEEIAGKTDYDFYPKELAEKYRADDKRVMESGKIEDIEEKYIQDGQERFVHTVKTPVRDEQGNVMGILGIFRDITERKLAEEALKESEERFRAIFDNANDVMLLAGVETKKFYTGNNTACQMLGYSLEEIKKLGVTDIHPKRDLPYVLGQFERQARREIGVAKDIPVKRKDGSVFYADVNSSLVTLTGRTYLLGIFRDITERKKIEETSRLVQLGGLVSAMAHEVNNPLMIISGNAQLCLMEEIQSDTVKNNLKIIVEECRRAKDIIQRLLKFSRLSKDEVKEVDINKSIEAMVSIVEHQFKLANIEIKRNYLETSPLISIDEQQMQEVFMNLINNAAEAMPNGGAITITTSLEGDFLRIDFKDTGCGMSEEVKKKALEPFFTTKEKGTGLGLSVCYGILKARNGEIKFESDLNKGATVTVLLPLKERG